MNDNLIIAGIADAPYPKLHTGFAQVSGQIYDGFYKAGFNLYTFGILDWTPDMDKVLPYPFWPTSPFDPMGNQEMITFVQQVKPDIVWIMIDPGNLLKYAINLIELNNDLVKNGQKGFKILAYPPIEGKPLSMFQATAIKHIMQNDGNVVFWCESAAREAEKWLPEWNFDYIYFGNDHLDARMYTPSERKLLRQKVGIDDFFMITSIGVNKRTKGFPTLIYTATYLKEWGYEDKIKFYCHTDPLNPTMQGHHLVDIADRYGVKKMFLWKPDSQRRGNPYVGSERSNGTYEKVAYTKKPRTSKGRQKLWETYDFTSRLDCMDLYVDVSQTEGQGMPSLEAMARGIPLISVHDGHVRDELYGNIAYMIDPLPPHLWETWHTGARLVSIDPIKVAEAIVEMVENEQLREDVKKRGLERTATMKWADTQAAMVEKVRELHARSTG